MSYEEKQLEWYNLTLEIIALRMSKEKNKSVSIGDLQDLIQERYSLRDHSQVHELLFEKGLTLYSELNT